MIRTKIHKTSNGDVLVGMADLSLIGKKFENETIVLDIREDFYSENDLDENLLLKLLEQKCSLNAIGKESVDFLLKKEIIEKEQIKSVKDIPYSFVLVI